MVPFGSTYLAQLPSWILRTKWPTPGGQWPLLTTFLAIESRRWLDFGIQIRKRCFIIRLPICKNNGSIVKRYAGAKEMAGPCLLVACLLVATELFLLREHFYWTWAPCTVLLSSPTSPSSSSSPSPQGDHRVLIEHPFAMIPWPNHSGKRMALVGGTCVTMQRVSGGE